MKLKITNGGNIVIDKKYIFNQTKKEMFNLSDNTIKFPTSQRKLTAYINAKYYISGKREYLVKIIWEAYKGPLPKNTKVVQTIKGKDLSINNLTLIKNDN